LREEKRVMPSLYVVATPIGNLEDISLRALRILKEVHLIAAEDTRKTKRLLTTYQIKTPLTSYHEHNKITKMGYILNQLESDDVALVSDAGMPGISDPGYEIIVAAYQKGYSVIPIPGASAVTTALAISGMPTDRFTYLGFLPNRSAGRCRVLEEIIDEQATLVILEAPHRVRASLSDMLAVLGDRNITVCRELTKIHEEVFRGRISQVIEHFAEPRGEFTLIIEGKPKSKPELTESDVEQLRTMKNSGSAAREAIATVMKQTGLSKRELYKVWIDLS